jgi:hypothetical protein
MTSTTGPDEEVQAGPEPPMNLISILITELGRVKGELYRLAIPAAFLEPRSLLEMYADFNSYPTLFAACGAGKTPEERFLSVCKWYFSAISNRKGIKKPYNPILGERFDCEWDLVDGGVTRFKAEQVTHHPPRSAYYIENKTAGVYWNGDNCTRSGFSASTASASVKNDGRSMFWLPAHNETYSMTFPDGYIRGLIIGPLRFELGTSQPATIFCKESGIKATFQFATKGMVWGDYDVVTGTITYTDPSKPNAKATTLYNISGKWNEAIVLEDSKKAKSTLFAVDTIPKVRKQVAEQSELKPFESRAVWAKVTVALRASDIDAANVAKKEIEDAQRAERKEREDSGQQWATRDFTFNEGLGMWLYNDFHPEQLMGVTSSSAAPTSSSTPTSSSS